MTERAIHPLQLFGRSLGVDKARYIQTGNKNYGVDNVRTVASHILEMRDTAAACGAGFTMMVLTSSNEDFFGTVEPATELLISELNGRVRIIDIRKFTRTGIDLRQWYDRHYGPAGTDLVSNVLAGYVLGLYPELMTPSR